MYFMVFILFFLVIFLAFVVLLFVTRSEIPVKQRAPCDSIFVPRDRNRRSFYFQEGTKGVRFVVDAAAAAVSYFEI